MKTQDKRHRGARRAGFTLIEIMLVVVIIGILAGIVIPRLGGRTKDAQIQATKQSIDNFGTALKLYEMDIGDYPRQLQDLIVNPGLGERWKGPYLEKGLPKDAWKNDYIYTLPGQRNPTGYDLKSLGPDGVESADDIGNWIDETPR